MVTSMVLKEAGDAGASWLITSEYGFDVPNPWEPFYLGPTQWAQLPNGRLKTFLARTFGSVADLAVALAEEDISTALTSYDVMSPMAWILGEDGRAIATTSNLNNREKVVVQIRLPHSTSI